MRRCADCQPIDAARGRRPGENPGSQDYEPSCRIKINRPCRIRQAWSLKDCNSEGWWNLARKELRQSLERAAFPSWPLCFPALRHTDTAQEIKSMATILTFDLSGSVMLSIVLEPFSAKV